MKPELQKIFTKLSEEKLERVELALVDDIKKQYQSVKDSNSRMLKSKKDYIDSRASLLSFSEIVDEQSKRLEELCDKLENAAKELGIDTPKEVQMYREIATSYKSNAKAAAKSARS
jgi:chromosome condensin MukBEF complex kleisin-like MukF subunit